MNDLREKIAACEHAQWAGWMEYLFANSIIKNDGSVEIPASFVDRWKRQMRTSYVDLSESEKESDRTEADKVLDIIRPYLESDFHS